jgi:hypothetical protein
VTPDVLVGVSEIAEIFAVSKNTALKYTRRPDFPRMLDRLSTGPVWSRPDVDAWGRQHLPLPTGRPRKHKGDDGG